MNYKLFIMGIGMLLLGWVFHRTVRGKRNEEDMSFRTYIGLWWCVIIFFIGGIALVINSLPAQI